MDSDSAVETEWQLWETHTELKMFLIGCFLKQIAKATLKRLFIVQIFCCVMPNTHRRRDATVELRRVGVGGVNTIRN